MRECEMDREPMCETSEPGERLIPRQEMLPISLEIGRRVLEVFGYQSIAAIVFRLRSSRDEIDAVIDGKRLPSTELLLGIHKLTGASIDWLLTGQGARYIDISRINDDGNNTVLYPSLLLNGNNGSRSRQALS